MPLRWIWIHTADWKNTEISRKTSAVAGGFDLSDASVGVIPLLEKLDSASVSVSFPYLIESTHSISPENRDNQYSSEHDDRLNGVGPNHRFQAALQGRY